MKLGNVRKLPQWTNAKIAICIVQDFHAKIFPTTTQRGRVPRRIEAGHIKSVWTGSNTLDQNGLF